MKQSITMAAAQIGVALLVLLSHPSVAQADADAERYTCPMHPHYISTDADGICPICGMDLVPLKNSEDAGSNEGAVVVAPEMIQSLGVRTATAAIKPIEERLRAFGVVEANERLESAVVSRIEGWIADLTVRAEGDSVQPGALLFKVYSPDLIAAQKELLTAIGSGNSSRVDAVRQRLRALGMQRQVVDQIARQREVIEQVPVYAESGGTVANLQVRDGDYVKPGTPILRLQAYSDVWVIASIPETDLPLVNSGLKVALEFPSAPSAAAEGTVDYIYPTIDPGTRTAQVRIEVDNRSGALRPGAYADITLDLGGEARVAIPTEAVLRDSRGAHVVIALGEGRFVGRSVRLGASGGGLTQVVQGLASGERVVVSGQFLLDSEVNLREGFAKLSRSDAALSFDTPLNALPVDDRALAALDHTVDMALYFHEALVDGYRIDPYYVDPAIAAVQDLQTRYASSRLAPILEDARLAMLAAKSAREGTELSSELARLTTALSPWLLEGAPAHYAEKGLYLFEQMDSGKRWLQLGENPSSPFGNSPARAVPWPDNEDHRHKLRNSDSAQRDGV
jgi:Cu(I)/Ag(I) efflux system membrane fusion protein